MKAKDLFFQLMSKFNQKFYSGYQRNGYEKCFTTYLLFMYVRLINRLNQIILIMNIPWNNAFFVGISCCSQFNFRRGSITMLWKNIFLSNHRGSSFLALHSEAIRTYPARFSCLFVFRVYLFSAVLVWTNSKESHQGSHPSTESQSLHTVTFLRFLAHLKPILCNSLLFSVWIK